MLIVFSCLRFDIDLAIERSAKARAAKRRALKESQKTEEARKNEKKRNEKKTLNTDNNQGPER